MSKRLPEGRDDEDELDALVGLAPRAKMSRRTPNVLQARPRNLGFYAFVTRMEGPEDGPWHVHAECLRQSWMDEVWEELMGTPQGQALLEEIGGRTFEALDDTPAAYASWEWYLERFWAPGRTPPELSTVEFLLPASRPFAAELEQWYDLALTAPDAYGNGVVGVHTVLVGADQLYGESVERQVARFEPVAEQRLDGRIPQAALKVLHSVHTGAPDPPDEVEAEDEPMGGGAGPGAGRAQRGSAPPEFQGWAEQEDDPAMDEDEEEDGPRFVFWAVRAAGWLAALLGSWGAAAAGALAPLGWLLGAPGTWTLAPAGAFPGGAPAPWGPPPGRRGRARAPVPVDLAAPLRYCGSPSDGAGAQQPDPMPDGQVAVFNIGHGNCNALYDAAGHILAYFDMGRPSGFNNSSWPAAGFVPCVCDRPAVILSHSDEDHYMLGFGTPAAHRLTWIVPEGRGQAHGGNYGGLLARIHTAGGRTVAWPANRAAGYYMAFPWGYVERASGADRNGSGLVAFVCVREDPAVLRARLALAALPAAVPGGAPANTLLHARPVVAALSGVLAATPAVLALAAARAAIAALIPVGGGIPGIAAAINGAGDLGVAAAVLPGADHLVVATATAAATAAVGSVAAGHAAGAAGNAARAAAAAGALVYFSAEVVDRVAYPVDPAPLPGLVVSMSAETKRAAAAAARVNVVAGAHVLPAHAVLYARSVAAALGAPAGWVTADEAAHAALRAVVAVQHGAAAAPAVVAVINGGAALLGLGPIPGGALPAWQATATANAAIATVAAGNAVTLAGRTARAAAAAGAFAGQIRAPSAGVVQTAVEPAHFPLVQGRPPFAPGERFVLLNGDANYDYVPSLQPHGAPPVLPVVVGMTAMHHGSYMENNGQFLAVHRIPWAPGSAAAGIPAVADAVGAGSTASAVTAVANHLAGAPVAGLLTHVAHAGASAAAAVLAASYEQAQAGNAAEVARLVGNDFNNLAVGTAAAVLSTLAPAAEAAEAAVAAVLGTRTRIGTASARDYAEAAAAARVRLRGAALAFEAVETLMVEAVVKTLEFGAAAALPLVAGAVPGGAAANTLLFARPVAADLAIRLGAAAAVPATAANVARAAVRAVMSAMAGAPNVAADINGAGAVGGVAIAPLVTPLTASRADSTARAALAVVGTGAVAVGRAVAAVGQVAAAVDPLAPAFTTLYARPVAVALAVSVPAPTAADAALAAVRAVIAALRQAPLGLDALRDDLKPAAVALIVNGGGGPAAGPANLGANAGVLGVALAAGAALATAESALATVKRGSAPTMEAVRQRAQYAAMAFSAARCGEIETAVEAVHPSLATLSVSHPMVAFDGVAAAALTPANVEAGVVQAARFTVPAFDNPPLPAAYVGVVSRLARAASAAAAVAVNPAMPPVADQEMDAALVGLGLAPPLVDVATLRGDVAAVMATALGAAWPAPVTIQAAARYAAINAMIGEAQRHTGLSGKAIDAALGAVEDQMAAPAAAAAAVAGGPSPGRIAYSYGVLTGNDHCYPAETLGNLGHPHPLSVAEYEARGWTARRNTPLVANHGGRQGDANAAHLMGHVALGWNAAADQNQAVGPVNVGACLACGQRALNA